MNKKTLEQPGCENSFGLYLKDSRINAQLSQLKVSRMLGYTSPQFISNWERGISLPPTDVSKKLVKIYEVNPNKYFEELKKQIIFKIRRDLIKKFYGI